MRFERRGGPPDLQAALKELVVRRLRGRSLDDNQDKEAAEGQFPDFACFRDIVLIEMKTFETDQHDRINAIFDARIDPKEKPYFYGSREGQSVLNAVSNGAAINAEIISKLGRTIETVLSKANKQFASYRSRHPRKNSISLCIILNSKLREYSPAAVIHAVHGKMKSGASGIPRFSNIDAVFYISEKHFQALPDGRAALAMAIYQGHGCVEQPWKVQFIDLIADAWSHMRTGGAAVASPDPNNFNTVQDIPERMKRYEKWQLEYQRNPYLKKLSVEQLREHFHRTLAVNSRAFFKGTWAKPSQQETSQGMRIFQHVMEEINRRGLDMRLFDRNFLTPDQRERIYIGLPDELVQILRGNDPAAVTR